MWLVRARFYWVVSVLALAGCSAPRASSVDAPVDRLDAAMPGDGAMPTEASPPQPDPGPAPVATGELCAREGDDLVRDLFCAAQPPVIAGLADLLRVLNIDPLRNEVDRNVVVTGHSTALSTRSVSAVNPRVIFVQRSHESIQQEMLAVAFVRGEQTAELVVRDRPSRELRFFLFTYQQACNVAPAGCAPSDLLTPRTESGWQNVTLLEEEDLKNTVLDCRQCHQPEGPGTPKLLRMQEIARPWTHWFDFQTDGGRALLADYVAMKGDEPLAGVPVARLHDVLAPPLVGFVAHEGTQEQPNGFNSPRIETEVVATAAGQPADNSIPGRSATWRSQYDIAKRGESISVPYHDVKVTDPGKLAQATAAYRRYLAGELPERELPDFRDIYADDPQIQAELGFATEPGLDGEGVLRQACFQCHNLRLDQSISRAKFVAELSSLGREQRDLAIERVSLPLDDPRVMPPPRLRVLSEEARQRLIDVLR